MSMLSSSNQRGTSDIQTNQTPNQDLGSSHPRTMLSSPQRVEQVATRDLDIEQTDYQDDSDPNIPPIDQPPSIARRQDHEPFQVLARHLSGQSSRSIPLHTSHSRLSNATGANHQHVLSTGAGIPLSEEEERERRETMEKLGRHLTPGGRNFKPPPDGGWEAWGVIMGAWFVLFVQFGISECFRTPHQIN